MQTKRLLLARDKSNAQFVLSQCVFYALGISRSVHVKDNLQQFLMNNVLYNVQRFFMDGPFRAKSYILFWLSIDFHDFSTRWSIQSSVGCKQQAIMYA